ncbi:MAG TPA: integrase core domain-containing protein [Hyphomicrobiaceae bacterium]|nr:integrase core domain-containing protein [Hyphomicrobiaceae bacterium]
MQIRGLRRSIYRAASLASRLLAAKSSHNEAARRRDAVARWRQAVRNGLTVKTAACAVGHSLAKLYRWEKQAQPKSKRPKSPRKTTWTTALVQAVEALRLEEPMWGRAKIAVKLNEQGFNTSEATVGRIIAHLVRRGVVEPVPTIRKAAKTKKWSAKRRFAERLPKHLKADQPGQIVQIDTVYVTLAPGKHIKHFTAYDPVAKWTAAQAFERATAASAARFLDKLVADMPFPVTGIQVDGGSEFMAQFETACQARGIKLYVLPPKSPEINGGVERCNSSWRYEFYAVYDLPARLDQLNPLIDAFQHRYNTWRPHGALGGLTPAQYLQARQAKEASRSHMS